MAGIRRKVGILNGLLKDRENIAEFLEWLLQGLKEFQMVFD
jgi:hypothetical protein